VGASATFLHLTDMHLRTETSPLKMNDIGARIPEVRHGTREQAAERLLSMVAERLESTGTKLDGVLFSGDAQKAGQPGGHDQLYEAIVRILADHGVHAGNIVATPGNHDVPRKSPPSSSERYKDFLDTWAKNGCIVPWLDGVHHGFDASQHFLEAKDKSWLIVPINSSNWCQAEGELPDELQGVWDRLPKAAAPRNETLRAKIAEQLDKLRVHDVARVSDEQLGILRTALPTNGSGATQLRIAVLHHHLRAPSVREDFRAWDSITDLELLRRFLRERNFATVIHGHKHEAALTYDDIFPDRGDNPDRLVDNLHRLAIVSGGTFDDGRPNDALRLLHLEGLPHTPTFRVESLKLTPQGADPEWSAPVPLKLWQQKSNQHAPAMISGSDINVVYRRVVDAAAHGSKGEIVIVDLDLPADKRLPLPEKFFLTEEMTPEAGQAWLEGIVEWWQLGLPISNKPFPFPHGTRLKKYGGSFDQIGRVVALLQDKPTSRAIVTLVDPLRDFTANGDNEAFASFCLAEFKLREKEAERKTLDIIGFYRVQEFAQWWPVNVAELRELQIAVCERIGNAVPGKITTITGEARVNRESRAQVAVSVLDRWHDSTPTLFHVLATILAGGRAEETLRLKAVHGWFASLDELDKVASGPWDAGAPIPRDGLALLLEYLKASGEPSDRFVAFRADVEMLRGVASGYANGKELSEHTKWCGLVKGQTERLRNSSRTLLEREDTKS
jgi:3',5'-cyclic AMP phosphodiesterase CpdA